MPEVKAIGGKADGQVINAPVELKHGKTFRHLIAPRVWAAASAIQANEAVAAEAETYRIVEFTLDSGDRAKRFIAVPVEWSDSQAFDRLLTRYQEDD